LKKFLFFVELLVFNLHFGTNETFVEGLVMTDTKSKPKKKRKVSKQFQTEAKQLLNLMIHSLYTHKEVFLRELLSNASDALDKARFQALTDPSMLADNEELETWVAIDKEEKTLSISDNGIGMTRDEVIDNIGTIARSGSKAFLEAMKSSKDKDTESLDLIGQFGVGFYSSFMVAHKVELTTRSNADEIGTLWVSEGEGSYTLEEVSVPRRGTTITLHLREEVLDPDDPAEDFLNQYTIQNLVRKYSDFITAPIKMSFEKHDSGGADEDKDKEEKKAPEREIRTMNSMTPLWERDKKDITADEYFQFYKHHFHDWSEPSDIIHVKVEGSVQYTALIFIPSQAPINLYAQDYKKGIQLYSKHIFVMDRCEDLLPDHLRFARGLIDSPDLTLNVSREILQHDRQIKLIGKNLEKKVMSALKKMLKDERSKYEEWWGQFGKAIKGGIYMHYTNKEKLQDLLLFDTSMSAEGKTTLAEYVSRMPEFQKEIYYEVGKDRAAIERLPQMEVIREKGVEVLYFTDKVDEFLTQNLSEYDDKKLKSASRGDFTLDDKSEDKEKKKDKDKEEEKSEEEIKHKDLLEKIKEHLGEKVKEVRLSKRLRTSAVCLVSQESGPSFQMEMLLNEANAAPMGRAQRILEINPNHSVFTTLVKTFDRDKDSSTIKDCSELLLSQAMLIEGITLEDPVDFANRINSLMVKANKK